ncbi:hypothetical protein AaE_010930 [Aphanomyces astaci]|uniref:GOLD domain-containing protein n=1 Tax=Aphanomyces astaci TaxID=112090 RepID=A0A6A4ZN06_APHAT|nr:hypothetical protein AaE_010930 [Aphanomyces astaci]
MSSTSKWLWLLVLASQACGTRFLFTLHADTTDCFYEPVDVRATSNALLVRFDMVDAVSGDAMDVTIESPIGRTIAGWTDAATGHWQHTTRESGLYKLCFGRLGTYIYLAMSENVTTDVGMHVGKSSQVAVLVHIEFLTAMDRQLTIYPSAAVTLTRHGTEILDLKMSDSTNGLVVFSIQGMSPSLLLANSTTRYLLSLSVQEATASLVESSPLVTLTPLLTVPSRPFEHRLIQVMQDVQRQQRQPVQAHNVVVFDVTSVVEGRDKLPWFNSNPKWHSRYDVYVLDVVFCSMLWILCDKYLLSRPPNLKLHADAGTTVRMASTARVAPDHWPLLTVERGSNGVEHDLREFQTKVWNLQSQLAYIRHHHRHSLDATAATAARLLVGTVVVSVLWVAVGIAQVVFVGKLLQ